MYGRATGDLWPGAYARPWALFHVGGRVGRSVAWLWRLHKARPWPIRIAPQLNSAIVARASSQIRQLHGFVIIFVEITFCDWAPGTDHISLRGAPASREPSPSPPPWHLSDARTSLITVSAHYITALLFQSNFLANLPAPRYGLLIDQL